MKKQTVIFIALILIVVLLIGVSQILLNSNKSLDLSPKKETSIVTENILSTTTPEPTGLQITITVDFGDSNKMVGRADAANVYETLTNFLKEKNMTHETKQFKYGLMVTVIGDKANSNEAYWGYSVNGKPGLIAADRYILNPNDSVEWIYQKN